MTLGVQVRTVCKLATLTLMMFALSAYAVSQNHSHARPTSTTQNLVRGVVGQVGPSNNWANYSVLDIIPGSALFPFTSSATVLYMGFAGGSSADITNMVLYTTARGSLTITAVTPVKFGGVSNPTIDLTNMSICSVPPSAANPCIVRFDPIALSLSAGNDYYFVAFFTNDSNNQSLAAAEPPQYASSFAGTYFGGTDYTTLSVGQSLPNGANRAPDFLMYVMNN